MFQLNESEFSNLKSQIVTSSWGGARRSRPYAFTEQGVAMLSAVLKSDRAVEVSITIIRVFVQLRQLLATHADLLRRAIPYCVRSYSGIDEAGTNSSKAPHWFSCA